MERIGPSSGSEFDFIKTHVIRDTKELIFEIDEYRDGPKQFLLVHIVFRSFSPSILKDVLREWRAFRSIITAPLYAVRNDGGEEKWKRFVSLFGFKPTHIFLPCNNGVIRELFISVSPDGK